MRKILGIFHLTLLLAAFTARAQEASAPNRTSPEWQKLDLVRVIEERIHKAVQPAVAPNAYLINVDVRLKTPDTKPLDADRSPASPGAATLDPDAAPFTLSKLGFWGPLLEDLQSNAPSGSAAAQAQGDIFSRIDKVEVLFVLDQGVEADKETILKQVVEKVVVGATGLVPQLAFEKKALVKVEKPLEKPQLSLAQEFRPEIGHFATTAFTVIVLGLFLLLVGKDFTKVLRKGTEVYESSVNFQREQAAAAKDSAPEQLVSQEENSPGAHAVSPLVAGAVMGSTRDEPDAFDRFRELTLSKPDAAVGLVKQWIAARTSVEAKGLALLRDRASVEELGLLFGSLDPDEKSACRRLLSLPLGPNRVPEGLEFIGQQLAEQFINVRPGLKPTTLRMVDSLTDNEIVAITTKDPRVGALLLGLLNPSKGAAAVNRMDPDLLMRVTKASETVFSEDAEKMAAELETVLKLTRSKQKRLPMLASKALDLLPSLSPDKEAVFYQSLARAGQMDLIQEAASKALPASLLPQLPEQTLRTLLMAMPQRARVDLLVSLENDLKQPLLDSLGKPGSKSREALDFELTEVELDEARRDSLKSEGPALWGAFVTNARRLLATNPALARTARPVVQKWIAGLAEQSESAPTSTNDGTSGAAAA